jgi:hypothetical protein
MIRHRLNKQQHLERSCLGQGKSQKSRPRAVLFWRIENGFKISRIKEIIKHSPQGCRRCANFCDSCQLSCLPSLHQVDCEISTDRRARPDTHAHHCSAMCSSAKLVVRSCLLTQIVCSSFVCATHDLWTPNVVAGSRDMYAYVEEMSRRARSRQGLAISRRCATPIYARSTSRRSLYMFQPARGRSKLYPRNGSRSRGQDEPFRVGDRLNYVSVFLQTSFEDNIRPA